VAALDPKNEAARDLALRARERLGVLKTAPPEKKEDAAVRARKALEKGHAAQALRAFDAALSAAKTAPELLVGRAEALMALGRYEEAVRSLLQAAALRPRSGTPYFHVGSCYRRLGDERRAAYYYRLFLSIAHPADPEMAPLMLEARRWLASRSR
jgi:Flp pilus assembly protein TadD